MILGWDHISSLVVDVACFADFCFVVFDLGCMFIVDFFIVGLVVVDVVYVELDVYVYTR